MLGFVPAGRAENLELRSHEPLLARRAVQRAERLLAFETPGIGPSGIGVVAPEEADMRVGIDRMGNVRAHQADSLAPVPRAISGPGHLSCSGPVSVNGAFPFGANHFR